MDWVKLAAERRSVLRQEVKKLRVATTVYLDQHPENGVQPTSSLEARRAKYNVELQRVMDSLHRRHIAFTHIPRRQGNKISVAPPPEPVREVRPVHLMTPPPKTKQAPPPAPPEAATQVAASEYLDSALVTAFSPRRHGDASKALDTHVLRSWFRNVPTRTSNTNIPAAIPNAVRPVHDVTQLTACHLLRQGIVPESVPHRGDGYLSGADRLDLRRTYAEQTYGYRQLRKSKHESRAARSTPSPLLDRIDELTAGVFVKAGDVGTYIRQDALAAASGMPKPDIRRAHNVRLGGTSKPRI